MKRTTRRVVAGVLIAVGVVLMLVAPDTTSGIVMIVLAVAIEIAGLALERRR
jgi:drug/metabolite transporter (DMT)-like permease